MRPGTSSCFLLLTDYPQVTPTNMARMITTTKLLRSVVAVDLCKNYVDLYQICK